LLNDLPGKVKLGLIAIQPLVCDIQIEVRKADSGQLIFKDSMSASVAAIVKGDYRGDGADQVVVCAVNGEVSHPRRPMTSMWYVRCQGREPLQ
jgi:hypothetical protein